MDFIIRAATINDIEALVELHMASLRSEDHIPVMLGRNYVVATYHWLLTSEISYLLMAESEGILAGLIAVCDSAFTKPMFTACLDEFFKSIIRTPPLLFKRKLWERLLRHSEKSTLATKFVNYPGVAQMTIGAVSKDFRGYGVFPSLIKETKFYSKNRGCRAIRAGMYKSNRSVRRAFEKAGWYEAPIFETEDTQFFIAYLDSDIEQELSQLI